MLGFVIHIYKHDHKQAIALLLQVRKLYPDAPITCIADGINPRGFAQFCETNQIRYIKGDRLKLPELGGAWLKRMLIAAAEQDQEIVFRIDPDTWIWRRFEHFPEADLFGTIYEHQQFAFTMVRGGCIAWRRSAIAQFLESGFLDDQFYAQNLDYYSYLHRSGERHSSACYITAHIAKRLQLAIADWPECRVDGRDERVLSLIPGESECEWAATHPHL